MNRQKYVTKGYGECMNEWMNDPMKNALRSECFHNKLSTFFFDFTPLLLKHFTIITLQY